MGDAIGLRRHCGVGE
jgi:hypothetical protein